MSDEPRECRNSLPFASRGWTVPAMLLAVSLAVAAVASAAEPPTTRPVISADAVEAMLKQAVDAERAGDIAGAAALRRELIANIPSLEARILQGFELSEFYGRAGGYWERARALVEILDYCPRYDPRYSDALMQAAAFYSEYLAQPGKACALFERETAGVPPGRGDPRIWFELAWTRMQYGDPEGALPIFLELLRRAGDLDDRAVKRVQEGIDLCSMIPSGQPGLHRNLETASRLSQYQARINDRQWAQAFDEIERLLTDLPDAIMDSPGVAGVGLRPAIEEILEKMPPAGKDAYRAGIEAAIAKLTAGGTSDDLLRLVATHPLRDLRGAMLVALADTLWKEGKAARAAAMFRLAALAQPPGPQRDLLTWRRARAIAAAGEPLPPDIDLKLTVETPEGKQGVAEAITPWAAPPAASQAAPTAPRSAPPLADLRHHLLRFEQAPWELLRRRAGWQEGFDRPLAEMNDAFIPYVPAGDRGQLFVNTSEMLYAVDPLAGKLLWARAPDELFTADLPSPTLKDERLLRTPRKTWVATSPDAVFARFNWSTRFDRQPRSMIFACARDDGALLWSTGGDPRLRDLRFATDPVYRDGMVIAGAFAPLEVPVFHLVALDALDGRLLWRTELFSGALFPLIRHRGLIDSPLNPAPPTLSADAACYAPGLGVAASVDLLDGHIRWLQTYPRDVAYGPGDRALEFIFNRPPMPARIAGDRLLIAPADVQGVHAFDTSTGKLLDSYLNMDFTALLDLRDGVAFVQESRAVAALSLADFSVLWRTELPTRFICGTATLTERGLLCGTRDGTFLVSAENGDILERRGLFVYEAMGNPMLIDGGVVMTGLNGLHVLTADPIDTGGWVFPRTPAPARLQTILEASTGFCRWALPAPDRGDSRLSLAAPDLTVIRTSEGFEMRRIAPAPSLLWSVPGAAWPNAIEFDQHSVLLEYPHGSLRCLDAFTGAVRWEVSSAGMGHERGTGGVFVGDDVVVWHTPGRLEVYDLDTGRPRWQRDLGTTLVRGLCHLPEGIGLFTQAPATAQLLNSSSGQTLKEIELSPGKPDGPVLPASYPLSNLGRSAPFVVVNHGLVLQIDFAGGQIVRQRRHQRGGFASLVLQGDHLWFKDGGGPVGILTLPELEMSSYRHGWFIDEEDNVQYCGWADRVFVATVSPLKELWETPSLGGKIQAMTLGKQELYVAVQRELGPPHDRTSKVQGTIFALRRTDGAITGQFDLLAGGIHRVEAHDGRLIVSDNGYLYRFESPAGASPREVTVEQDRADPFAIAALRIAADWQRGHAPDVALGAGPRAIDSDLGDWPAEGWRVLSAPRDWLPDPALFTPGTPRLPLDAGDLSASVAAARDDRRLYLAVHVRDDIHDAGPHRPPWRGDSLRVRFGPATETDQPSLGMIIACVDHLPLVFTGQPPFASIASFDTADGPAWLHHVLSVEPPSWLPTRTASPRALPGVDVAVRRDDRLGETVYELAIELSRLPAPPTDEPLRWDLAVNESDGAGCEGALTLGTSFWENLRSSGSVAWKMPSSAPR